MKKGIDYPGVAVVFACHDGQGSYLLSKRGANCRAEQGRWDPGGGGVDFGDSVEETLRREVKEEYCTDVIGFEFLGYRSVHRVHDGVPTHWVALDFRAHIDPAQVRIGEPHKFDEIGWFTLDNLPAPLHSQFPLFLEKYREKLI